MEGSKVPLEPSTIFRKLPSTIFGKLPAEVYGAYKLAQWTEETDQRVKPLHKEQGFHKGEWKWIL